MKSIVLGAMLMAPGAVVHAQTYQENVVAAVLVAEASSEGLSGMKAVAEVIRQRAAEKGKTPFQVVTAGTPRRRAFSCLTRTTPDQLYRQWRFDENYSSALAVAAVLVRQPAQLGDRTRRATHYTRKDETPYWAKGKRPVAVIGQHAFYRLAAY